ncbi:hypothetical protein FSP39_017653, partial [Pinctada imbricata]
VSDNGPQFASEEFRDFAQRWKFEHITSSPHYPQSNGKAEQAVKVAKQIMRKAKHSKSDPYLAILDYRNTPTQHLGMSPAQRLMNRRTKTLLPTKGELLQSDNNGIAGLQRKFEAAKAKQAEYFNRSSRSLPTLKPGDLVRVKTPDKPWQKGTVISGPENHSYHVETERGGIYRRNRRHIRRSSESTVTPRSSEEDFEVEASAEPISQPISEPNVSALNTADSVPVPKGLQIVTRSGRISKQSAIEIQDYVQMIMHE